jgi:hypothetical protein
LVLSSHASSRFSVETSIGALTDRHLKAAMPAVHRAFGSRRRSPDVSTLLFRRSPRLLGLTTWGVQ